jgi:hypothetical protein
MAMINLQMAVSSKKINKTQLTAMMTKAKMRARRLIRIRRRTSPISSGAFRKCLLQSLEGTRRVQSISYSIRSSGSSLNLRAGHARDSLEAFIATLRVSRTKTAGLSTSSSIPLVAFVAFTTEAFLTPCGFFSRLAGTPQTGKSRRIGSNQGLQL